MPVEIYKIKDWDGKFFKGLDLPGYIPYNHFGFIDRELNVAGIFHLFKLGDFEKVIIQDMMRIRNPREKLKR